MGCFWSSGLSDEKEDYFHLDPEKTPNAESVASQSTSPEDFQRVRYDSFVGYRERVAQKSHLSNDSIGTLRDQEEKIADDYFSLHEPEDALPIENNEENTSGTLSYSPPSKRQRTEIENLA